MATFTDTWNAAFEVTPADTEARSLGANRMRQVRKAVGERLVIDHSWAGDGDDGTHKQVTFVDPLGADPSTVADQGFLYTKNVSSVAELFWMDEAGNVIQLTTGGVASAEFPVGTPMLFQQTAAPTGWTKETTHNNKAIRLQTGTVTTGGGDSYSTVFGTGKATDSHVLAESEMPSHTHAPAGAGNFYRGANLHSDDGGSGINLIPNNTSMDAVTASTGGGGGHTHDFSNLDLEFVDFIIATKD